MRITIVGGGNIGHQFAVHCAEKGHEVTVCTSRPEVFSQHLSIMDQDGHITHQGVIKQATNDPIEAYRNADFIMITLPANAIKGCAQQVYRYSKPDATIGVVPGNGGSECVFSDHIRRGNTFFLLERVPAIARIIEKGKTVKSTGYRRELHLSSLPASKAHECCNTIEHIFDIPCIAIPSLLNLTMTPSNPILHTARLRCLFADYHEGKVYDHIPLFYEEWDEESSKLLLASDDEVQKICRALPELKLHYVKSLRDHYEASTPAAMAQKLASIPAFKGIATPSVRIEKGLIPDLHSRYFTADFSFGLSIIQQIAMFAEVSTPTINETMDWYNQIKVEREEFRYSDYHITDRKSLVAFYSR